MKKYHIEGWNEADGTPIDRVIEIDSDENIEDVIEKSDLNVEWTEI